MNAPINAALKVLLAGAEPRRVQPTVTHDAQLLVEAYEHGGIYLDLYGTNSIAGGYDVEDVSLTGTTVALTALFSRDQLRDMSRWCNRKLPSASALGLVSQQEAAAERIHWERSWPP